MQQAEERGLGILRDQHFPVALSYEDLVAVYSWLLEGRVHFKRLEERMLQQAGSVIHKMISEQDGSHPFSGRGNGADGTRALGGALTKQDVSFSH